MEDTYNKVAFRYAKAFFLYAKEKKMLDVVFEDFKCVYATLEQCDALKSVIDNVLISSHKKKAILEDIFSKKINSETMRFIFFLGEKKRLSHLMPVVICYRNLFYDEKNMLQTKITSALDIDGSQQFDIINAVEKKVGKKIVAQFDTDSDLIAGFKIDLQDHVLDLSALRKLQNLKEHIGAA